MARKKRAIPSAVETLPENPVWKAAIYCRLSVEDGDDTEQNSIGNQKKIGLHYLSETKDIVLFDTYCDNGFTGMNDHRPGFQRMFHDLQSGIINCIIVKDISRLGRNYVMTADFVERVFPERGIRFICINDDYDSMNERADAHALTLPLKMVMNDYYAKDISNKIRSSISAKMDSGEFLPASGSIPYGYIRTPENNTFSVDPETAPVVVRIFQMRADGMSFNSICRELNRENILCPGKLRYERGITSAEKYRNAFWIRGTVRKITQNREYTGCRIHGKIKRDRIGLEKRQKPESEWIVIENSHPPIVSTDLFEKVQAVNAAQRSERENFETTNDCVNEDRSLFRGIVYCADCHSPMLASKRCARHGAKAPSHIFYDCGNYRYSAHTRCFSHYIGFEAIYGCVKNALDRQIQIAVDVERLVEKMENDSRSVTRSAFSALGEYDRIVLKRKNIEAKIERLLIDLTARVIDRSEYDYMKSSYDQERLALLEAERAAEDAKKSFQSAILRSKAWLQTVRKYQALPELTPEIVGLTVKEILVFGDRRVKVILNFEDPYKMLEPYADDANHFENQKEAYRFG